MAVTLVTGATGFIGRLLVEELVRRGESVRAAIRDGRSTEGFGMRVDPFVTGDLSGATDDQLRRMLDGARAVIHLAARAHVTSDRGQDNADLYQLHNQVVTKRLAEAAARQGVERFVLVSSIKVFGESDRGRPFSASDECLPVDAYGRSKLDAERALWRVCSDNRMSGVVVRPPLVYGPSVRANFLRLMKLVDKELPLPLGAIRNRRSMVSADNLVDLLCLSASHPGAVRKTLLVSDDHDLSTPDLLRKVALAMGRRARLFPVPVRVLRLGAAMVGFGGEMSRVTDCLSLDIAETKSCLEWTPPQTVDQAIATAVRSYRT